jgi:hypothetical protein
MGSLQKLRFEETAADENTTSANVRIRLHIQKHSSELWRVDQGRPKGERLDLQPPLLSQAKHDTLALKLLGKGERKLNGTGLGMSLAPRL